MSRLSIQQRTGIVVGLMLVCAAPAGAQSGGTATERPGEVVDLLSDNAFRAALRAASAASAVAAPVDRPAAVAIPATAATAAPTAAAAPAPTGPSTAVASEPPAPAAPPPTDWREVGRMLMGPALLLLAGVGLWAIARAARKDRRQRRRRRSYYRAPARRIDSTRPAPLMDSVQTETASRAER